MGDLDDLLAASEAKRNLGLVHLELLQVCEPLAASVNKETEPRTFRLWARKSICHHAARAVTLNHEKQELREQKDAAYAKLEQEHEETKQYQGRLLNDFVASENERAVAEAETRI